MRGTRARVHRAKQASVYPSTWHWRASWEKAEGENLWGQVVPRLRPVIRDGKGQVVWCARLTYGRSDRREATGYAAEALLTMRGNEFADG